MLFRFSAITFNGHRIHYDQPYATGVELYPGIVVHAPLTASLCLDLAAREFGPNRLSALRLPRRLSRLRQRALAHRRHAQRATTLTFTISAAGRVIARASASLADADLYCVLRGSASRSTSG